MCSNKDALDKGKMLLKVIVAGHIFWQEASGLSVGCVSDPGGSQREDRVSGGRKGNCVMM